MMKNDLTIIYLTAGQMPFEWQQWQMTRLSIAAGDSKIFVVSQMPIAGMPKRWSWMKDDGTHGYWNIYMQMLRAAKVADTPFVAIAEDDVLYTPEHFREYRPKADNVAFDRSRWSLFAWEESPIFCLRQRVSNCSMIASRAYLIECLEERKARWPNGPTGTAGTWIGEVGRPKVDRGLGVTVRQPAEEFWCTNPIVHLNHMTGTDRGAYGRLPDGRRLIKPHGQVKAVEIPYWGRAIDIVRIYAPDRSSNPETVQLPLAHAEPSVVSPQRYAG
jgi:hypothetical protein